MAEQNRAAAIALIDAEQPVTVNGHRLSGDEVAVWWARPSRWSPAWRDRVFAVLSSEEEQRAERFRLPRRRELSRAAHGLLRIALASHMGVNPRRLEFSRGAHGKPALVPLVPGGATPFFSLSHTRDFVGCAVSAKAPVGFDAEDTRRDPGIGIAAQFFSAGEIRYVEHGPTATAQRAAFYEVWTLREAYSKALGLGLALPFGDFALARGPAGQWCLAACSGASADAGDWRFRTWHMADHYRCAVAWPEARTHELAMSALPGKAGI